MLANDGARLPPSTPHSSPPALPFSLPSPPPLQQIATATASFPPPPNPTTMAETLSLRGTLEGHSGWVTSIATPIDPNSDMIVSASR